MNADAIVGTILDDARAEAARILGEADARAAENRARAEAEVQALRERAEADARRETAELQDRMLRMAALDQRKAELAAKREVIDQVFALTLQKMQRMPADQKKGYLEKLLLENAEGDEQVILSDGDAGLLDEIALTRVNVALARAGKVGRLSLSPTRRALDGGFLLKKGGMEVNCTFRALLNQSRPALEAEAANLLFGQVE
jgi:V/A-type H+-transporting ATPase subunit E